MRLKSSMILSRASGPFAVPMSVGCARAVCSDFPGRVQVQEGNYSGGGETSKYIGRSDGNLGMEIPAWPVENPNPFGK